MRFRLIGAILASVLMGVPAFAQHITHPSGELTYESYVQHQEYFRWCFQRWSKLYEGRSNGDATLAEALGSSESIFWTELRDREGRVWLAISSRVPSISTTGWETAVFFPGGEGLSGRAYYFGLSEHTPVHARRVRGVAGDFASFVSLKPDARTLGYLRYWADPTHREGHVPKPGDIELRPRVDVSLAFPILITGFHREFRSGAGGTWLSAFSLGVHGWQTRDSRLLLGGVEVGAYGTPTGEKSSGWGVQVWPVAVRVWKGCPVGPLYAAPSFTRVWAVDDRGPANLVGVQFILTGDPRW